MNKSELKSFAVSARRDLLEKVALRAKLFGIDYKNGLVMENKHGQLAIKGKIYPKEMENAFLGLDRQLKAKGYEQLIEEVAYTWFNRIIAIRYMEVNEYLPERVNVLSSSTGKAEPDILLQYETMELDVNRAEIAGFIRQGETEKAYRKLFVAQCNKLNDILPFLFEQIDDYTELLLPDFLLDQESVISRLVNEVSLQNFYSVDESGNKNDNVEILGWLYQYYMAEKKEEVGGLRNNSVKKEHLPVVTQLFTPKWIVQYMVQNSLGKLYDEKYEQNKLSTEWEYYLKPKENKKLIPDFSTLEELKFIDPACGSGHILVYAFDLIYAMYEEAGYSSREIPQLILEKNLYGLDIDKRAQQIANFALMMKAVEKQPRLLSRMARENQHFKMNVFEIVDTDDRLPEEAIDLFVRSEEELNQIKVLQDIFENGKQFGSLIKPHQLPYQEWINRIDELEEHENDLIQQMYVKELKQKLLPLLNQGLLLGQKYDIVVTNPPYHNKYNPILKKFLEKEFKDYKYDLYSAFIYRTTKMTNKNGYAGLMTPFTWMFISSYEKLRRYIIENQSISSLVQLEYSAFKEATVPICTFVVQNQKDTSGTFVRLSEFRGESLQPIKVREAKKDQSVDFCYRVSNSKFRYIPGKVIAYWLSERVVNSFKSEQFVQHLTISEGQTLTGNNNKYLKLWWEIADDKLNKKWVFHLKGGAFRRWSGNEEYVIDWSEQAIKHYKSDKVARLMPEHLWFREAMCWSMVSNTYNKGFRFVKNSQTVNIASQTLFFNSDNDIFWVLAFLNSKIGQLFVNTINPTLNLVTGDVQRAPLPDIGTDIKIKLKSTTLNCIELSDSEWYSFETAFKFESHPFLIYKRGSQNIENSYSNWERHTQQQFNQLKSNEEELNRIFIEIYGLEDEFTPEVPDIEVTIRKADRVRDTKSFLSYFIGCVVGRYSLDVDGIVYAGGDWDETKYKTFKPSKHGLVLLTDERYFEDDIIARLLEFLTVSFSADTVEENLEWIAQSLEIKKGESVEERLRRYFIDEFFKDHLKIYQKRPIYWLVDSGKEKGLRTLIYLHRYQPDTMATIRFEHLQEIQAKYSNEVSAIDARLVNPNLSASEKRELEKKKTVYQKRFEELLDFDKELATYANQQIPLDLDDGVKVNYEKFEKVLAKI